VEILRALQAWSQVTNANIGLVSDGAEALGTPGALEGDGRFGDIRIASMPLASTAVATATKFNWSGTTWAGDTLLNSNYPFTIGGQYDLFTIMLHEAGHIFGQDDDAVNTASALYENFIKARTGLGDVDIANVQALYGVRQPDVFDRTYHNESFAAAAAISNDPSQLSFEADITRIGEAEYYKIVTPNFLGLSTTVTVQLKAAGVSLLVPRLELYDAGQNLVASTTASSPLKNDLTITLKNVQPSKTYYIKADSASHDFGIGAYRLDVGYQSLLGSLVSNVTYPVVHIAGQTINSIQNALPLPLAFGPDRTDQRFDYVWRAGLVMPIETDYYKIQSPAASSTTTFVMHALAWEMDPNGLHPVLHVFDSEGRPLALDVLTNSEGMYTVQVRNLAPSTTYYVEVAPLMPWGANNTGKYFLGIKFDSINPPLVMAPLANSTLATAWSADSATLNMKQNSLFHFVLGADNGSTSATSVVDITVYDQKGSAVFSIDATTGQPPTTTVVYLITGAYTVRTRVVSTSGSYLSVRYGLSGRIFSDPIGPYASDATNSSTAPDGSPGGGYTYPGGSASSGSSSPPTYY
jgi:hypothetical protein